MSVCQVTESGDAYEHSEKSPYTDPYLSPIIFDICRRYSVKNVLDIGCGNGYMCKRLVDSGLRVVGIEPSESGIQIARKVAPKAKFYKLGVYDNSDIIAESDFDMAVCTEVIEHLYYPFRLPMFAKEKLAPDGILVISTPYWGYLKNLVVSLLNRWDRHHNPLWDGGHIKFWSRKTLTRLLELNGFTVLEVLGTGRRLPFLWKTMLVVARNSGRGCWVRGYNCLKTASKRVKD